MNLFRTFLAAALVAAVGVWAQVDWSANQITVTTEAQLKELAHWVDYGNDFSGKTVKLGEDITLTSEWKPIGNNKKQFKGTFDGGGKSISELLVSDVNYAGLFGYVGDGGQIKNLIVNVTEIKATKKERYEDTYAGGLVAYYASTKIIENCGVNITDSIHGSRSGGLVGNGDTIIINSSYANGKVSSSGYSSYSGGLVGSGDRITITNSYATGKISNSGGSATGNCSYSGGLVGRGAITIINSYTNSNISGDCIGGLVGYGSGTIKDSYTTGNISGSYYSGGLAGDTRRVTIINSYATGDVSTASSRGRSSGGLVGSTEEAIIINSYANGKVSSSGYSGGLVGSGTATITNSYTTGDVSAASSGETSSGGLVGNGTTTITNSYAKGNVSSFGSYRSYSGGLVGSGYRIIIFNSYAIGNVSGSSSSDRGFSYFGGLVGISNETITIINSYATGDISDSSDSKSSYFGGLVGKNKGGKIENSYALGSVKGKISGGIVGENHGAIINCYYLAGTADMPVGKNESGTVTMTSGMRTEEQMKQQGTYKDWDFKVWEINGETNNGYPNLVKALAQANGGTFTDTRDGKKYKFVKIFTQTWMAENLNHNAKGSKCYDNKPANCNKYGRLYDWATAKNVCPKGWHLPSDDEWAWLDFVGAGAILKTKHGWNNDGNGDDIFSFSALPGGFGAPGDSSKSVGHYGYWWSSTSYLFGRTAWYRRMDYNDNNVDRGTSYVGMPSNFFRDPSYLHSVRCLQD